MGCLKFDDGKPRVGLLPFKALLEIARVFTFGAKKYSANNWQELDHNRIVDAGLRHFAKYLAGEDFDEESGLLHLAHLGANVLMMLWQVLTYGPQDKFGE